MDLHGEGMDAAYSALVSARTRYSQASVSAEKLDRLILRDAIHAFTNWQFHENLKNARRLIEESRSDG